MEWCTRTKYSACASRAAGTSVSDRRGYLVDAGGGLNARTDSVNKGYNSKSNRVAARQRGICPVIPYRSNTKDMPAFFPKNREIPDQTKGHAADPAPIH